MAGEKEKMVFKQSKRILKINSFLESFFKKSKLSQL